MSELTSLHSLAQTVKAGTVLFEEGTTGGGMIILLSGRLAVYRGGHKVGTIAEPGAYVGESTVLTGQNRTATVVAESSATLVRLTENQANAFLNTPAAENKVVRHMSDRLRSVNQQLIEKLDRITNQKEAMTEMLQALRTLYIEMEKADASRDAYYEAMRALRRLVNTYGTGRYTKTRILI